MQKKLLIKRIVLICLLALFGSCGLAAQPQQPSEQIESTPPPVEEVIPEPQPEPSETAPLIPPITTPAPPQTEQKIENQVKFPISFETPIHDHTKTRMNNIRIAAKALCKTVIKKGKEFSFNTTVGERTKDAGYQDAIIFVDGKKVDGLGGGICQISSTIYNAALLAGFKITERHVHALPVTYVAKGKDATVAYNLLDLRFVNNSQYDIKLWVSVSDDIVKVTFY